MSKIYTNTVKNIFLNNNEDSNKVKVSSSPYCTLTTAQGTPIAENQNSLKIGKEGPVLLEDHHLREKLFHFDHERIPERVVHARGYGAHGFFQNYESLADITSADIFARPGEQTPAFVRFSTVAGNKGSSDLTRDIRGFAVKLYTRHGNWDIVGNNIPVFFIQDAIKFPDLIHAAKQEPDRGFPQASTAHDNFWDFISLTPESMHMIMWIMSDRTLPRSFRFMEGFGVHTFRLVNKEGKSTFVKFHWKPKLGIQSVLWNEAVKINGVDPDFHRRDLWNAIQNGDFPEWELGLQLFDEEFAKKFDFSILDPTKLIPEEEIPVKIVGKLVLNRMVDNFFAETEQVAFCTSNIVPGVDFSNDPLLAGRNFSYLDTQLKRLGGPNFTHIPVNAPKCPFANFQRDGHMNMQNPKGRINYEPNSGGISLPKETPQGFKSFPVAESGEKMRIRPESFSDHYSQARQFYLSQTSIEQKHIESALIFELGKVEQYSIQDKMISHLLNIDSRLAHLVADGLGFQKIPTPASPLKPIRMDLPIFSSLSIMKTKRGSSFKGRKLGILISNNADSKMLEKLRIAVTSEGGQVETIAPKVLGAKLDNGVYLKADHAINAAPSVLFDAIAILCSREEIESLSKEAAVKEFISDAFFHLKFIGYTPSSIPLLKKAGIPPEIDEGCIELDNSIEEKVNIFLKNCHNLRYWNRKL